MIKMLYLTKKWIEFIIEINTKSNMRQVILNGGPRKRKIKMQGKVKKKFLTVIKILFSVFLISWLFKSIKWSDVKLLLQQAELNWLAIGFAWIVISVLVSAYKWQLICKASNLRLPFKILWRSYWAGLFFNNFLPSSMGGDALRIYWSGKFAGDMAGAASTVIVERILATMGLSLLALAAVPFSQLDIPYLVLFFFVLTLCSLLLLVLLLVPALPKAFQKVFQRFPRVDNFLEGFQEHGKRMRQNSFFLFRALFWSVVFQICVVMVNWSIFKAFHISQVSLWEAALLIPATSVAAMIPLGINGYGTREGAYISLFAYLGVSSTAAMTSSVVFALLVTVSSLWGGWIWLKSGQEIKGGLAVAECDSRKGGRLLCPRS